jgi:hypothetical protein
MAQVYVSQEHPTVQWPPQHPRFFVFPCFNAVLKLFVA